jgi:putative hydrolase of the HAD superfamily
VSANELGFGKPDPRIYLEACRRAGVAPEAVLHVGDDLHLDVRAARQAGLRAAWVTRPDLGRPLPPDAPADEPRFDDLAGVDAALHPEPAG